MRRSINTKITDELRERLEQAALANGRNLSREVEARLLASFDEKRLDDAQAERVSDLVVVKLLRGLLKAG